MIVSWGNSASRRFFRTGDARRFRGLDGDKAIVLLDALNIAASPGDLGPLKSLGLHRLQGDRRGCWAMTVNGRWRICFRFRDGDAHDVELVDYHRG